MEVPRFEPEAVDRDTTGTIEAMPLWAGESVSSVTRVQPAAEIIRELATEAERLLRQHENERQRAAAGVLR